MKNSFFPSRYIFHSVVFYTLCQKQNMSKIAILKILKVFHIEEFVLMLVSQNFINFPHVSFCQYLQTIDF